MATETVGDQLQTLKSQADKLLAAAGATSLSAIKETSNTRNIIEILAAGASEELALLGPLVAIGTIFLACSSLHLIILAYVIYTACIVWIGYRSFQRSVKQELKEQKEKHKREIQELENSSEKRIMVLKSEMHAQEEKHKKENQEWEQRYTADIKKWEDKFKELESVSERRNKDLKSEIDSNDDNNREWRRKTEQEMKDMFQKYIKRIGELEDLLETKRDKNERLRQKENEATQTEK